MQSHNTGDVTEEVRVALETERRFEFYIIGAIFTIFGLAIQNVQVYESHIRNILTLVSFLCLVVSTLVGILALSLLMKRHWIIADLRGWRDGLQTLQSVQQQGNITQVNQGGQQRPIAEVIAFFPENLSRAEIRSVRWRYWIDGMRAMRNWAFLLGLTLLLVVKVWPVLAAEFHVSMEGTPPCKNGAQTCNPWERDWGSTKLQPGSTVTKEGVVVRLPSEKP